MGRSGPTIVDIALEAIRARGPLDTDALTGIVVDAGRSKARDPRAVVASALEGHPGLLRDWDDRWRSLVDQLDGAMFSHRLSGLERRDEIVFLGDDLYLIERIGLHDRRMRIERSTHLDFVGDFFELPYIDTRDLIEAEATGDGSLVLDMDPATAGELVAFARETGASYDVPDDEVLLEFLMEVRWTHVLHGRPGWIPPMRHDGLLGLTIHDGAVEAVALDRRDVRGPHVALAGSRIAALARRVIGPDPSWFGPAVMELVDLLELVVTEAPEVLRRPLPPLSEVIMRAGLEVEDGLVGHAGTDWEAYGLRSQPEPGTAWGYVPPDTVS